MSDYTKAEKASLQAENIEYVRKRIADGWKLAIQHIEGIATRSGRSDYLRVLASHPEHGIADFTFSAAMATGNRYNDNRAAISIGGYGYSKTSHLQEELALAIYGPGAGLWPDKRLPCDVL